MWREDGLLYENGRFCARGFAFGVPDGFLIITEPEECCPGGFGAWAPGDKKIYVEWEIEKGCNGTYEELRELFNADSGMFPINDISPIIINGLPGHHVIYSDWTGQRYEIRLSSGAGNELSFRVRAEDTDILTAISSPAIQSAIKSIWSWKCDDEEISCQ